MENIKKLNEINGNLADVRYSTMANTGYFTPEYEFVKSTIKSKAACRAFYLIRKDIALKEEDQKLIDDIHEATMILRRLKAIVDNPNITKAYSTGWGRFVNYYQALYESYNVNYFRLFASLIDFVNGTQINYQEMDYIQKQANIYHANLKDMDDVDKFIKELLPTEIGVFCGLYVPILLVSKKESIDETISHKSKGEKD